MKAKIWRYLFCLILILPLFPFSAVTVRAQESDRAEQLLAQMTPAEKVGQLFLITFDGAEIHENSRIYSLINNYHVGGVVLSASHENFVDDSTSAWQLIQTLQEINWQSSNPLDAEAPADPEVSYIPLYIGMNLVQSDNRTPEYLSGLN